MKLSNDTKIKFCNAVDVITGHARHCDECKLYLATGDGDLCDTGKDMIACNLAFTDTVPTEVEDHLSAKEEK